MKKEYLSVIAATAALVFFIISVFMAEQVQAAQRKENDTMLSDEAFRACKEIGEEYGISPELIMAIAETESGGGSGSGKRRLRGIDAGVRPVA